MVRDFFSKPAELVLVAVSEALMRPSFRINSRFQFTGYCRWQAPEQAEMNADLSSFCRGRRVPVITFGSMVYPDPERWMNRLAAHWPEDKRLIVQSGWAGFQAPAGCRHIRIVGPISHDQLVSVRVGRCSPRWSRHDRLNPLRRLPPYRCSAHS